MKTAQRKPAAKSKTKAKAKPLAHAKKMKMKKVPKALLHKKPVARITAHSKNRRGPALAAKQKATVTSISDRPKKDRLDSRVFNDRREYDRRVFVRFDNASKDLVKQAAPEDGMSPYIAHFASQAAHAGKKVPAMPVTGKKDAGVFARFDSPTIKDVVRKAAASSGLTMSAYAAYFALEAAKAGKKMPGTAKEQELGKAEKTSAAAAS